MSSILLRYLNAHPTLAPTYILSGPLKSTSKLAQTQLEPIGPASPGATQSLAHLATQGVKIVDMDQMSDDERNSEVDEAEDDVRMTNDDGALDEGAMGIKREGAGDLQSEEVPRWGVVMVSEEGLEGESCLTAPHLARIRAERLCIEKKRLFEQDKLSIHVYALSPSPVKVRSLTSIPGPEAEVDDLNRILVNTSSRTCLYARRRIITTPPFTARYLAKGSSLPQKLCAMVRSILERRRRQERRWSRRPRYQSQQRRKSQRKRKSPRPR